MAIAISNPELIKSKYLAAEVNGEPIKLSELNRAYDALPAEYKQYITKAALLDSQIEIILLKQEAEAQGIKINDEDFNKLVEQALQQSGLTKEQLETQLKVQGKTMGDIKTQFLIKTLLEKTIPNANQTSQQTEIQQYIESLREKADIKIYLK